jgi:uncharacterized Zn-binding protein involved in type VI secretion
MLAARLLDFHQCPMQTVVGPVTIPHVGGPVLGPGAPTVLIGGKPAATVGDMALCIAPVPDVIVKGSQTVKIMGRPAARIGDATAHGGKVLANLPPLILPVLIGG